MVFKVPPVIVDGDGGWFVSCDDVVGEGNNMDTERGPVSEGEGEFLNAPEESDVESWIFDDDEEGRTFLSR